MTVGETAPVAPGAPSPDKTLRTLFLLLFLRGRSARGLAKDTAPTTVARKLWQVLAFYAFFGMMSVMLVRQSVFVVGLYLHVMTFVLLGLFIAASAGDVLFNKEEADILLHRPIAPRALLRAKISVLVQIALWQAVAFNLAGFFVGAFSRDGGWLFPVAHLLSTLLEALFCTAVVVVSYQLCLRWFGRERLDAIMTATQVIATIAVVVGGQLVPQLMLRMEGVTIVSVNHWWVGLLPPAWFSGIDDAIAGSGATNSWRLAAAGVLATTIMIGLALGRLANAYQTGLQTISETTVRRRPARQRRLLARLVAVPPLSWWLRDSAARASFLLSVAYLARDRETKLRVYPGLAPMLIMPVIMLMPMRRASGGLGSFAIAFAGSYVGLLPLVALGMLGISQQWQAADVFRVAPVTGPAAFCHGARRAVLLFIALPMLLLLAIVFVLMGRTASQLMMLLPGIIALPLYAMYPCVDGKAVPFSRPQDDEASKRSFMMFGVMISSAALAGIAAFAHSGGWFGYLLAAESIMVTIIYIAMRRAVNEARWPSMD